MTNLDAHVTDATPALDRMLKATEVAQLFRVSTKTVGRWGRSGALPLYRTVGGHHRYRLADVIAFLGLDEDALAMTWATEPA